MKAQNKYLLPVPKEKITKIVKGESEEAPAHVLGKDFDPPFGDERKAVDYYCEEGTLIYAAQDGEVVWIKSDSNEGGKDRKYASKANGLSIKHLNDEFTNYLHLKYNGVLVTKGQQVKKGDIIGYVGTTGWTPAPHLHFSVLKITGKNPFVDYVTLEFDVE
jgi:murein DD-endopeptidase MepM/ murein hydrolase activator NlpD